MRLPRRSRRVYSGRMRDLDAVRAFVERPFRAMARDKERYWASWKQVHGAAAGLRVADALRAQVKRARPDWPSEQDRRDDLEMHLQLIEVIRRAGRASP